MSGKASKPNSYWLGERNRRKTDAEKSKFEKLNTINYSSKHVVEFEKCHFVEKCCQEAKQRKIVENAIKYSKGSKNISYFSVFRNFKVTMI